MKKMKKYFILAVLIFITFSLKGETTVIPGDVDRVCAYTNFFYNFPAEDFFYYLNERLLFTDKPDGKLLGSGMRNHLLRIVRWHRVIKKSLQRYKRDKNKTIAIDVTDPRGYKQASVILKMLGLTLEKTPEGKFRVTQNPGTGFSDYFRFTLLKIKTIENQLNKAKYFYFKLRESEVAVPWDYAFLSEVTGKKIDASNFFETLLKDEHFSLFLGVLYRLSDKEIDYIGGLVPGQPMDAWKRIYGDKKFVMGLFILSDALRVKRDSVDGKGYWALPGGNEAAAFWNELAEKKAGTSPFEFLQSLVLKDDGKLNYFYLFSYFLPPETQKILFTGPNAPKTQALYRLVSLTDREKLKNNEFPHLRGTGLYTFLYSLQTKDRRIDLPHGAAHWLKAMRMEVGSKGEEAREARKAETETKEKTIESLAEKYADLAPTARRKKATLRKKRIGVYLGFGGGVDFLDGGDFDTMIEINEPVYASLENPSPTGTSSFFRTIGGEIGYNFGKFSLGLEIANIHKNFNVDLPFNYLGMDSSVGFDRQRFGALSVLVNCRYKFLDTALVNMYISGGGGLYTGKYKRNVEAEAYSSFHTETYAYTNMITEVIKGDSKQSAFGFHVGASLEFFVLQKMAFWVEGRYRSVEFNNMKGEVNQRYSHYVHFTGTNYTRHFKGELNIDPDMGTGLQGRSEFFVSDNRYPEDEEGLRKAFFSMKGFSLSLGLKWYF